MSDLVLYASIALSLITAGCGLLLLMGYGGRAAAADFVTAASLRVETDRIRADASEQARSIRLEITQVIRGFQDTLMQRLDAGVEQIRLPINGIGQKLDVDIATMGKEASQSRETLRSIIEAKLDASGTLLSNSARELREELIGNFEKTSNVLSATTKELGGQQLERLDGVAEALKTMSDRQTISQDALRSAVQLKLDSSSLSLSNSARELREELIGNFGSTSNVLASTIKDLGNQQLERLNTFTGALTQMSDRQTSAQETLRLTVENRLDVLRTENSTKLDEMRQTVDEKLQTTLEQRLGDSFNRVVEQLERVHKGIGEMQSLASGVGDLKKVLSNVTVRGALAEHQLGMLLEQFLSSEQFVRNATVKEGSSERVEFAVRLPGRDEGGELLLPVDAKFPNEDYLRLLEAAETGDPERVSEARRALENRVRLCAKMISEKYINVPRTTDFAILFLPTESLYAEVLRKPGLFEQLQRDFHVTLTGPVTLTAFLSALQMGFRTLAIEKRSSEVWQVLGAVRNEFSKYNDVVEKLAKNLQTAANSVDALGQRTRAMNRKLKDVEMIPADKTAEVLEISCAAAIDDDDEAFAVAAE